MISFLDLIVVSCSLIILLIIAIVNKAPPPIFNVYRRPNGYFYIKLIFMYTVLSLRKIKNSLLRSKQTQNVAELEKPQKLSTHPNAIDAVYFNGSNGNGDYLVVGTARRKNRLVDGFLYLLVEESGLGVLETPKLPGTSLYQTEESEEFGAEGIKIFPVKPMQRWLILYEGNMKRFEDRTEVVHVKIECVWDSDQPYFNFDNDMDSFTMAKSMAFENFSRDYFKNLQENHQTHYEQHGDIKGLVTINNKEYQINLNALRDHSFGLKREWRNFHRYGLHFFTTENGDRFNVGSICLPISFSRLSIGYVYEAKTKKIHPIKSLDLELYQHGEQGEPPKDYAFRFTAGSKSYTVQVTVLHSPHFYISKDWESKIVERLSTFKVNGVKGWGAAEWQYRNIDGKNVNCYNNTEAIQLK